jgi:uncharacterized protein (TIGR02646 family)
MKYIVKGTEPQELTDFKADATSDWTPTYGGLTRIVKNAIKKSLMREQGYICCYCERRIEENDSHIEHFKPQNDSSVDPLDFTNMLCSCQKNLSKGADRHCGNLKGGWFDEALLVSPMNSSCESQFGFNGDGTIYPIENNPAAKTTIKRLGLDINKLNNLRKLAIDPFLDDELNEQEFKQFVEGYLQQGSDGRYNPFPTTIAYLFRNLIA